MKLLQRKKQQGAVLVVVILLLLIMMLFALSLSSNSSIRAVAANSSVLKAQAFQAAESGSDTLLALFNEDDAKIADIKATKCTAKFIDQYKSSTPSVLKTTEADKRKVSVAWFACTPVDSSGNVIVPNCGAQGECFSVIISGVACPSGTDASTNPSGEGCIVSRHLQGYGSPIDN